jgi:hypothetical protein
MKADDVKTAASTEEMSFKICFGVQRENIQSYIGSFAGVTRHPWHCPNRHANQLQSRKGIHPD